MDTCSLCLYGTCRHIERDVVIWLQFSEDKIKHQLEFELGKLMLSELLAVNLRAFGMPVHSALYI